MGAFVTAAACVAVLLPTRFDGQTPDKEQPADEVQMEVTALRTFIELKLTDDQIKRAAALAKETAEPGRKRNPAKASADYRQALVDLRNALASQDDTRIEELDEKIDRLQENETAEVDDGFGLTPAARQRGPELFKTFAPAQLAAYYGAIADRVIDPQTRLLTALEEVRSFDKAEWREKRDALADEIASAGAGTDAAKEEKVSDQLVSLLSQARSLSAAEYKARRPDLEKAAKEIAGDAGAEAVLRNYVERALAELLSNPRLEAAAKLRMK